jgi:hypothetical protein
MKLRLFSIFWQFPIKSADSGRVLKAVTTAVGAGDSVGGFDSKAARKSALLWSLVTGRCDELAVVKEVVGRKTASLEVNGLA